MPVIEREFTAVLIRMESNGKVAYHLASDQGEAVMLTVNEETQISRPEAFQAGTVSVTIRYDDTKRIPLE